MSSVVVTSAWYTKFVVRQFPCRGQLSFIRQLQLGSSEFVLVVFSLGKYTGVALVNSASHVIQCHTQYHDCLP